MEFLLLSSLCVALLKQLICHPLGKLCQLGQTTFLSPTFLHIIVTHITSANTLIVIVLLKIVWYFVFNCGFIDSFANLLFCVSIIEIG